MSVYVSLIKFTQPGLSTMKSKGVARADQVKKHVQSLGGRLIQAYYCLGKYDVVAIWDFPNNRTAMKAALLNAAMGHIQITTMPAVTRDDWKKLLQETWGGKKKPR